MSAQPATVLPFRSWAGENERLIAYYIALSVQPELKDAAPIVRTQVIDRVIAGWRAALKGFEPVDELDRRGHGAALALMEYDRETAAREGWRWGF